MEGISFNFADALHIPSKFRFYKGALFINLFCYFLPGIIMYFVSEYIGYR
jgi:hypothetical protein